MNTLIVPGIDATFEIAHEVAEVLLSTGAITYVGGDEYHLVTERVFTAQEVIMLMQPGEPL